MTRTVYHQHLDALRQDVLDLGQRAERSIESAMVSLERRDLELARRVIEEDYEINRLRFAIEENAVDLIATQQPMASDLRTLIATLHIATELERIGDYGEGIAHISVRLGDQALPNPLGRLRDMADVGMRMMRDSLAAFTNRDADLARAVCDADDELDALYDANYAEVINRMLSEPKMVKTLTYQLWAAHNLERIGDRATNICERVVYLVTGRMEEINVSRY
jgi:phosphate transport system protein